MSTNMIVNPAFGIYQTENWDVKRSDINHTPRIGYHKDSGRWCPECRKRNFYNWISITYCKVCEELKRSK